MPDCGRPRKFSQRNRNKTISQRITHSLMDRRRVAITGIGIWSCIGQDIAEVTDSLRKGRSGIGIDQSRLELGFQSGLTGIVPRPELKGRLDRRMRTTLAEEGEYAFMASSQALQMAGIGKDYLLSNEVGCIFGNDTSARPAIESIDILREKKTTALMGSGYVFQSMNSTVTMNLQTIFNLRGVNFTVSAACASGSHAIGLGCMMIRQGMQDIVLCGGAQETNLYSMASFDAIGTFSRRHDEPSKASRPFDRGRDGLVPSGGAAALVLEDYDHALARKANIIAEVLGYGFSANGGAISEPSSDGSALAMSRALKDAGLEPKDIDYVNAHATSTPDGDDREAEALRRLFGDCGTPVSSTKSMTGHECWMAGASEAVYSILMMKGGFLAPNINFEHPSEAAKGLNIVREAVPARLDTVLSNSFGFGGTNSALVIKDTDS